MKKITKENLIEMLDRISYDDQFQRHDMANAKTIHFKLRHPNAVV